jgi:uncharacterized cupredoxin-like copper-binding protein
MRNAVLALSLFVVAACGQDEGRDYSQAGPPENTTAVVPSGTVGTPSAANPQQTVELSEYAIHMPQSVPSGKQYFRVVNAGKEKHSFEIEGNGVEAKLPSDLAVGDIRSMDVTLKPGTYTVYCPVPGHKEKGMVTTLTVK